MKTINRETSKGYIGPEGYQFLVGETSTVTRPQAFFLDKFVKKDGFYTPEKKIKKELIIDEFGRFVMQTV